MNVHRLLFYVVSIRWPESGKSIDESRLLYATDQWTDSVLVQFTLIFEPTSHDQSSDQSSGSSLLLVATGSALALLFALAVISFFIGCRRGLSELPTDTAESELDIFMDSRISHRVDDCFVSEENALSSNGDSSMGMMILIE
jgi:hypothetical protein